MDHKSKFENQNQWTRKSKVYKAKTFSALKELYGSAKNDKDVEDIELANGTDGANFVRYVVEKTGI